MIGTPAQLRAASTVNTVAVADANLTLSSKLKSLGVIIDSRLSFDTHVAMVCKTCNYHIWALRHIRRLLPLDVARTLACSIVGARLDYCNSVLYGAPTLSIQKLQRVQNSRPATTAENVTCSPTSQVTSLVTGSSENRVQSRSSDVQDTLYFSSGVPALAAVKPHQWIYGDIAVGFATTATRATNQNCLRQPHL